MKTSRIMVNIRIQLKKRFLDSIIISQLHHQHQQQQQQHQHHFKHPQYLLKYQQLLPLPLQFQSHYLHNLPSILLIRSYLDQIINQFKIKMSWQKREIERLLKIKFLLMSFSVLRLWFTNNFNHTIYLILSLISLMFF